MYPILGLVGPSGSGKSTLILEMGKRFPERVAILKSLTTRAKRGPEDDLFYDFVSVEEMRRREANGRLVQISEYAGNLYAHDREHADALLKDYLGICALVEQGVLNLRGAGYEVKVIKIIPQKSDEVRDEARRKADEERKKTELPADLVIENSFESGGFERAAALLSEYISNLRT